MNKIIKNILVPLIIVAIAGTGIYFWKNRKFVGNKENQNLDYYVSNYRNFEIVLPDGQFFLPVNKEGESLEEVFRIGMEKCSPDSEGMTWCAKGQEDYISGITLLADKNWTNGKNHEFYIEFGMEGPPLYHGPFYDNVLKLLEEAKLREDFIKIEQIMR